jgi:pimeloyl-ACP methyl ester carboxylesterase
VAYARNALDAGEIYFEDDGGAATPVVLHGGFLGSVSTVRDLDLARALRDEFRLIYVDQRGFGRSDKPHDPDAYETPWRSSMNWGSSERTSSVCRGEAGWDSASASTPPNECYLS